jgi:hypothetical protein
MASLDDDDTLLGELRRLAAEADPMPEAVLTAADAAIGTRDLDSQLAVLLADTWAPESDRSPEQVRGGGPETTQNRVLIYAAEDVRIDVGIQSEAGSRKLIGQITGASTEGSSVERPDGTAVPVEIDDLGRFLVMVDAGPVRLRCLSLTGTVVVTAWLNV